MTPSRRLTYSLLDLAPLQPNGKDPSHWVVLARNAADYGNLVFRWRKTDPTH